MFERFKNAIKGGLAKLNIIKTLNKVSEHKQINQNSLMYDKIDIWRQIYSGMYEDIHKLDYQTIEGPRTRTIQSMQIAKISTNEMASLIYNEKCEINIDNETVDEFVKEVFKNNKFDKNFQDYLEYAFAMGGMAIKPYYDSEKQRIMLSFVTADNFVPVSWRNGNIYEALFHNTFKERDKFYTHLEWHKWDENIYTVTNELYEAGVENEIGIKVSLKSSTRTENLEPVVTIGLIKQALFSYFRPNTANNFELNSPLGISIYGNAIDTIRAIDTAFDSFHREFRLGKKRILVPSRFIKTVVDPDTGTMSRYFDATDETYEAFNGELDDAAQIKDISTELRVEEHVSAINALLNIYAMQTGFSSGTFTFNGQSMKTATEVISENSKTYKTKQSHQIIIEEGIRELVGSIVALGQLYDLINFTDDYELIVVFDDSIAQDKTADTNQQIQLVSAGLQSKRRAIMEIFGLSEDAAQEVLMQIIEEENMTAPQRDNIESAFFGPSEE